MGRYIESDPIGLSSGSLSTYAYAGDSPSLLIDRYGLLGSEPEEADRLLPSLVTPEAKKEICSLLNALPPEVDKTWLQRALKLEVEKREKFGWDVDATHEADNFLEAAGYPEAFFNSVYGIFAYQYLKLVPNYLQKNLLGVIPSESRFSLNAMHAAFAGVKHQHQTKGDIVKWCNSCDRN